MTSLHFGSRGGFFVWFALPFIAVGIGTSGWLWRDFLLAREIQASWVEKPAAILSVEWKVHTGSKGSRTYAARGEFRYDYDGVSYVSDRIALDRTADNIGDFQRRVHREMKRALQSGKPMTARVNPRDPSQAILRPEWRQEMALFKSVFGSIFGLAGVGMFTLGLRARREAPGREKARLAHPDAPWLWRTEWRKGRLCGDASARVKGSAVVLAGANLPTLPLWFALGPAWTAGGGFRWALAGALAAVVTVSFFSLRTALRAWKHQTAFMELPELPLRLGRPARLVLHTPWGLPPGMVLSLEVVCIRASIVGSGKNRRTKEETLWKTTVRRAERFIVGEAVEFVVDLPSDMPPASPDSPETERVYWRSTTLGRGPGPDLFIKGELPVF